MNRLERLLGDLYNWRCPACVLGRHDECDPDVPWLCACSHPTCLTRPTDQGEP